MKTILENKNNYENGRNFIPYIFTVELVNGQKFCYKGIYDYKKGDLKLKGQTIYDDPTFEIKDNEIFADTLREHDSEKHYYGFIRYNDGIKKLNFYMESDYKYMLKKDINDKTYENILNQNKYKINDFETYVEIK